MDPTAKGLQTGSDQVLNLLYMYGPYKLIANSKLISLVPSLSAPVPIGISPPRVLVPIDISPPWVLVPIDISPLRVLVPLDIPPPRSFIYTSQVIGPRVYALDNKNSTVKGDGRDKTH